MKVLVTVCTLLLSNIVFSQDTIVFINRYKVAAKIFEVNITNIKYKLYANPDGPEYIELKENIFLIKYSNGDEEKFLFPEIKTASLDIINNKLVSLNERYFFIDENGKKISKNLKPVELITITSNLFVIKNIPDFKLNADKALINIKRQKQFGVMGAPFIGASLGLLLVSFMTSTAISSNGNDDFALKGAIVAATLFTTGVSFEIISLINGDKKKKRLKTAIDLYNRNL